MSEQPTEPQTLELEAINGVVMIPVDTLPPGSLITITIRVGPEPVAEPAPPEPTRPRHMGSRINAAGD